MKKILYFLLLSTPSMAVAPVIEGTVIFNLAPWNAQCQVQEGSSYPACDIPRPLDIAEDLSIELKTVTSPGSAAMTSNDFYFKQGFTGRLKVFSVYPQIETGFPPYLQVMLEIAEPVNLLCAQSIKWEVPFKMPPLICASLDDRLMRWGLTLTN